MSGPRPGYPRRASGKAASTRQGAGRISASAPKELTGRPGPYYTRQIPRGAPARTATDKWARRGPDRAAAAAVAWADEAHDQPHRARRDIPTLTR